MQSNRDAGGGLLGADESRQTEEEKGGGGRGKEKEHLSPAYLKFSLCLITNHSPDSAGELSERRARPPSAILIYTPSLLCLLLILLPPPPPLPPLPSQPLGAARWPLKRQTCNLIINNLPNFSWGRGNSHEKISASCP